MHLNGQILLRVDKLNEHRKKLESFAVFTEIVFGNDFLQSSSVRDFSQAVFMKRQFPTLGARRFIRNLAVFGF